jgi:glycosyltransferase involved in cell wall biosynthesis
LNLGAIISPYYILDSIFYYDYKRNIEYLNSRCNISLAANLSSKPSYVDTFLKLNFPHLLSLAQNRYMTSLSHISGLFSKIRYSVEKMYDKYMSYMLKVYFRKLGIKIFYYFPQYPESYIHNLHNKFQVPVVTELWEDKIEHLDEELRLTSFRKHSKQETEKGYNWVEKIAQTSDCLIVPTKVLKNRLTQLTKCKKKISVIPVCQDVPTKKDPDYIRVKHNLQSKKILFYLGSLCHYHDLETILSSLKKVKSPNISLLIAGGIEKKRFEKYSRLLKGLNVPVIYLGQLDNSELEYYISAADVCLSIYKFSKPSGFFPASVVKFMLAEKPIIATDLIEIREMFKNEKAGFFVKQRNVNQLAYAIDFLLDNLEERLKLGEKAGKIAQNNYLWQHHTQSLMKIFDNLT